MAIEKVKYSIKVFDNFIEIIPDKGMQHNSTYEIKMTGVKSVNGNEISESEIKFTTAMTPSYCTIMDVASLIDIVDIPDDIILYNIREASRYANYIYEKTFLGKKLKEDKVLFEVKEFVRYKAAKDCMLKIYMSMASDTIEEGTLGEVKFKTRSSVADMKKILEYLDQEIKKWMDAISGYHLEGKARMKTTVKGYKHKYTTPKLTPLSMNRGVYYD